MLDPKPNNELTREDIAMILTRAGIPRGSGQWGDYAIAKRAVFGEAYGVGCAYEEQICYITDYLGV